MPRYCDNALALKMISCPDCGYCPKEERQKTDITRLSAMDFLMLSFGYDELDCFEVLG